MLAHLFRIVTFTLHYIFFSTPFLKIPFKNITVCKCIIFVLQTFFKIFNSLCGPKFKGPILWKSPFTSSLQLSCVSERWHLHPPLSAKWVPRHSTSCDVKKGDIPGGNTSGLVSFYFLFEQIIFASQTWMVQQVSVQAGNWKTELFYLFFDWKKKAKYAVFWGSIEFNHIVYYY